MQHPALNFLFFPVPPPPGTSPYNNPVHPSPCTKSRATGFSAATIVPVALRTSPCRHWSHGEETNDQRFHYIYILVNCNFQWLLNLHDMMGSKRRGSELLLLLLLLVILSASAVSSSRGSLRESSRSSRGGGGGGGEGASTVEVRARSSDSSTACLREGMVSGPSPKGPGH